MKIVDVWKHPAQDIVIEAVEILREGGIIVFPTDTAYGLGVNALDENALEKLFELKGRPEQKPLHMVVWGVPMAEEYVHLDERAHKLVDAFLPGPLTLVLKHKENVPPTLVSGGGTVGVRIPDMPIALSICYEAGLPFTATSANKSGNPAPYSLADVEQYLGDKFDLIDYVIDAGNLPMIPVSTLVDLSGKSLSLLREGPITLEQIKKALEK